MMSRMGDTQRGEDNNAGLRHGPVIQSAISIALVSSGNRGLSSSGGGLLALGILRFGALEHALQSSHGLDGLIHHLDGFDHLRIEAEPLTLLRCHQVGNLATQVGAEIVLILDPELRESPIGTAELSTAARSSTEAIPVTVSGKVFDALAHSIVECHLLPNLDVPHCNQRDRGVAESTVRVTGVISEVGGLVVSRPEWNLEKLLVDLKDIRALVLGHGENIIHMNNASGPTDNDFILLDLLLGKHSNAKRESSKIHLRGHIAEGGRAEGDRLLVSFGVQVVVGDNDLLSLL